MDKYAIEACAASILSEVFEKPKLAAKLLDKFQSSFNSSMPMLPVLYEDSSTDEGLPSDVLICRDKGPCGLIDVLLVSHGRPSSELSRDNLSRYIYLVNFFQIKFAASICDLFVLRFFSFLLRDFKLLCSFSSHHRNI